jgi:hypothetical protein
MIDADIDLVLGCALPLSDSTNKEIQTISNSGETRKTNQSLLKSRDYNRKIVDLSIPMQIKSIKRF